MSDFLSSYSVQLWLIGIITFLLAYNFLIKQPWRRLPPGPPSLPLVGSIPFLGLDPRKPLKQMADKYGDVFTVYLGLKPAVVLNGYETIKDALVKNGHVFSDRPRNHAFDIWSRGYGIVSTNGKVWQEQRNFALQVLRQFGVGRSVFEERILEEISFFIQELSKHTDEPFNPQTLLKQSLSNVISSVTFGKRYDYEDVGLKRRLEILDYAISVGEASGMLNILPFIRYLPGDLIGLKRFEREIVELQEEFREAVKQHKQVYKENEDPKDFIDVYLKKINTEVSKKETTFSDEQLLSVVGDLFIAGTETVATSLAWAVIFMTLNPLIQSRVQAEIDGVVNNNEDIRMDIRKHLPFTEACILETSRVGNVVPLSVPRATTEDTTFKGYFIPQGTMILPTLTSIHMDPNRWSEPNKFTPDRFLDSEGKITGVDKITPFGSGKRECLGRDLAKMELFLYFTSIMKHFKFSPAPGYPVPDTCGVLGGSNVPKPFHVIMETRDYY